MIYPEIHSFLDSVPLQSPNEERLALWTGLAKSLSKNNFEGDLNFICTHNARRSILSQSLGELFAAHHGFKHLNFWSGGAETTFVHPNTIKALKRIGFRISAPTESENPLYLARFSDEFPEIRLFSKAFDDPENSASFHAILVCAKGDAACPFIPSALSRNLIPFEDPGNFDHTPEADAAYDQAALLIATELNYFFAKLCQDNPV